MYMKNNLKNKKFLNFSYNYKNLAIVLSMH